jgi:hypothetical protein
MGPLHETVHCGGSRFERERGVSNAHGATRGQDDEKLLALWAGSRSLL